MGRPGACFAERANGAACDVVGDVFKVLRIVRACALVDDAGGDLGHPEAAFAAGGALSTAFVGVELVQVVQGPDHVARVVHDHHAAASHHGASGLEAGGIHRQIEKRGVLVDHLSIGTFDFEFKNLAGSEDLGGTAAGDDGLEGAAWFESTANIMDQLAESHSAAGEFVEAGANDIAAHAHGASAAVAGGAHFGIFLWAHGDDVLHMADRFHIVHDGRLHVEAEHGWEIRWLDAGVGAFAFEGFEKAGFLAANVGASALVDIDVEVKAGAEDVFSEKTFGAGFLDGVPNDLGRFGEFAADVDVGEVDIRGEGGYSEAFDELVRVLVKDVAVLECARLGFVAVDDDVVVLAVFVFDEAPLGTGGEARSATATQVSGFHHVDDLTGLHGDGFFQGLVATVGDVGLDVGRVAGFADVSENDAALFRVRRLEK